MGAKFREVTMCPMTHSAHNRSVDKVRCPRGKYRVFMLLFSNSVHRTRQGVILLQLGPPFNVLIRGTLSAIQPLFTSH